MKTAASPIPVSHRASNYDEFSMQQTLQFSDRLKDLKSLKQQLYSAAEYFESSYSKHDQTQMVMSSLKDYALKALVNTVDHLGSISYKVNCLLNEKSDELSTIELPFSCFEQRLQACQQFINHGGLSQQSLLHKTHNHHTRYVLPDLCEMSKEPPTSFIRRGQSPTAHVLESLPAEVTFSFTKASPNKRSDKRATSPFRFQLMRSGSVASRSSSPSPSSSNTRRRYPSEPRRSASPRARAERDWGNDLASYASKNKRMFKALLSMRKPKKGGSLYKYLDEN